MNKTANPQNVIADGRLFWFVKEGTEFDLSKPSILNMYVQQVVTHGRTEDIKMLLKKIGLRRFSETLEKSKRFLPEQVRRFWEDFFGNNN